MKIRLLLISAFVLGANGIFAADLEKELKKLKLEEKEASELKKALTLEGMPPQVISEILQFVIGEETDFSKAAEAIQALMINEKLKKSILAATSYLSPYISKKFFSNDKNKASNELIKLSSDGMLSSFALKLLLEAGADPNQKDDSYGNTALKWAVTYEERDIVKSLLEAGADINMKDKFGDTALMVATRNRNRKMVETLIEKIKKIDDLNIQNNSGYTALDLARKSGYIEIVTVLEKAMKEQNQNKN